MFRLLKPVLQLFRRTARADSSSSAPDIQIINNQIHVGRGKGTLRPLLKNQGLSIDISVEAKCMLARKISRLLPTLAEGKKLELLSYTARVLKAMARDQMWRVRQAIAEELKEMHEAPHDVILSLAWDKEIRVASPVLEYSPVLTDDDLIEIVRESEVPGVLEAIVRRKQVPFTIAKEVIWRQQPSAIEGLLQNPGANINEDSMFEVIEQAPTQETWHRPLVGRQELTNAMLNKVAEFVSESLLDELHAAGRIDQALYGTLRRNVMERLSNIRLERQKTADTTALKLYEQGLLKPSHIDRALERGQYEFVHSALALMSGFSLDKVRKILESENARAITALAWKAGLSMRTAMPLQLKVGKVPHTRMLHARSGVDYPLEEDEMRVYLDLFAEYN